MIAILSRRDVVQFLSVSERTSYKIITSPGTKAVRSDALLRRLNEAARNGQPRLDEDGFVPILDSPESLAFHFHVQPHTVRRWTKRAVNPCPYYQLAPATIRFQREAVEQWTRGITFA